MPIAEDGYELGDGMVMALAHITNISPRPDQFLRFRVDAELIGKMRPGGLAPVFKIFTARTDGSPITLPVFDRNRLALPSWESDPTRPLARAYTALDFTNGDQHITFDALNLHDTRSWTHRAKIGDTVGIIGFKHELALSEDSTRLLLVGDRSAKPAIDEIIRSAPSRLRTTVISVGEGVDAEHAAILQLRLALNDAPANTVVWIAGEVEQAATMRCIALANGIAASDIIALPYWHQGLSREQYDHVLYRRYQAAADNGESLTNHETIARVELTPVNATEAESV